MGEGHDRKKTRDGEAPDAGEKDLVRRDPDAEGQETDVEGHLVRAPADRTLDTQDRTL